MNGELDKIWKLTNIGRRRLEKVCQINEINMVRPLRENSSGKNVKTLTPVKILWK